MKLTREEVLKLAKDAGFLFQALPEHVPVQHTYPLQYSEECFHRFAALLSDHVAVIGAKPDSVHLDKPTETSTDTSLVSDPHPPSRHCMCDDCKPSFEADCLGRPAQTDELALAQLGEFAGQVGQAHLAALVDELRPDAERFRFLVNQDIENDFPRAGLFIGQIPENYALTGPEAIAKIDKAMNALQSGISSPTYRPNEKDVVVEGKQ